MRIVSTCVNVCLAVDEGVLDSDDGMDDEEAWGKREPAKLKREDCFGESDAEDPAFGASPSARVTKPVTEGPEKIFTLDIIYV